MLASIHSIAGWAAILLLGVVALLATRVIGMLFRGKMTGILVVMLLVGPALLFALLLPGVRGPGPKVTPLASPMPPIGLPSRNIGTTTMLRAASARLPDPMYSASASTSGICTMARVRIARPIAYVELGAIG